MKAVRFHRHGGPEVLRYEEDVPDPVPENGEALVRVRACALNHLDLWARNGLPNVKIPLPHISGSDISGVVEWVPDGEREFKKGAEVIVSPGISCGRCEKCLLGMDNQCRFYTIVGYEVDGGYAELVKVPRTNLIAKPSAMDFVGAASFPLVFLTAYHMLVSKARVQAGESVLVLGAGSGVGSAAIQVAKLYSANVIATAGEDEKLVKARELGADHTINHRTQDIAEEARKLTGKRGVDVVVEHVGRATWEKSLRSLAKGGRLVTCGATTGGEGVTDLRYVFSRELSLHGSYMGSKGELLKVVELFRGGKLKKVVDSVYPLKDARAAQERMERSEHFGKIVLTL
ncbi:MAG TPA: zinc-binding dehydrogenase [Nitrososphaerales archaeon]|nr:zinc-binding dehydrogenase [Nitrososphaerales archaeon]